MPFDPSFLMLMSQTASQMSEEADDGFGNRTYSSSISFPCHITYKRKVIRGDTEENAVSTAQIQLPPAGYIANAVTVPQLAVDDIITLPDGIFRRVLDITTYTDNTVGTHHQSCALT
jgi:hypothetical protein